MRKLSFLIILIISVQCWADTIYIQSQNKNGMILTQGVPAFNPETTTAGARAASALLNNVFAAPAAQAQLSQQQAIKNNPQ